MKLITHNILDHRGRGHQLEVNIRWKIKAFDKPLGDTITYALETVRNKTEASGRKEFIEFIAL